MKMEMRLSLKLLALSLLLLPNFSTQAQLCSGNLGDNSFSDGDFGSGVINIIPNDLGIAPGYTYNPAAPPFDGEYVITNNMGSWSGLFGTWLPLTDNSTDANGYMMVVNASFDPGLFYEQTVTGLCENTIYEFSADIINVVRASVTDHSSPNVSFLLDGQVILSTGDIPQDEQWHSFGFTFTTESGQDEVLLSLRNNAPGGIGNDLALDNISFRACGPTARVNTIAADRVCLDGSSTTFEAEIIGSQFTTPVFQWQRSLDNGVTWSDITGEKGMTLTTSDLVAGSNQFRYIVANSEANLQSSLCRINSDVFEVIGVPTSSSLTDTICDGLQVTFGGVNYTQSGTYRDSLVNELGCDSIVTLYLTVMPDLGITPDLSIAQRLCEDDPLPSITVNQVTNGYEPYSISLDGASSSANQFTNLIEGDYQLFIEDRLGCSYTESITINSMTPFDLSLGDAISVTLGESVQLSPQTNFTIVSYQWNPSFLCSVNCTQPTWFPTDDVVVTLHATSELGCEDSAQVEVSVEKVRLIQFPNAFTPNADGRNDRFTAIGKSPNVLGIQKLLIFDRWGKVVGEEYDFQPNDLNEGWDGTKNGTALPAGVYTYYAEVLFLDLEVLVYRGAVWLQR